VYEAFKKQHEFVTRRVLWYYRITDRVEAERSRMPLKSSLMPGCMEKGYDAVLAGPKHTILNYMQDRGVVDVADSLTAIRQLVFKEKRLTMTELLDALDSDFAGERGQEIQKMCLAAPKYGNDIDEADVMVRELGKFSAGMIGSQKNPVTGKPYTIFRSGLAWHYWGGKGVGALANGRKSHEPLNDGSLSPMRGMDKCGPTAVIKSALKADFKEAQMALLNQKFSATVVQSEDSLEKLAAFTETYLGNGGSFIQYNLLDKETLLDAQKHPEQYQDLVVRVAGFCTYFVTLSPEVQDDIIRRTEQGLA
jgi:formate C-acetyltransferase